MNHARHHFFSHAAFPVDENRHVHRRDLQHLLADVHHLRAGRQETEIFGDRVAIFPQRFIFRAQLLLLPALQHGRVELGLLEWLGQVILRAQCESLPLRWSLRSNRKA